MVTFPHPPLFSHNGYCLPVDVKRPSILGCLSAPLLVVLVLIHHWLRVMMFSSPTHPALPLLLAWVLHIRKACRFAHSQQYGVLTLRRSRSHLVGLVPLMGKASVSNIAILLRFVIAPNAPAMACWSVLPSLLVIVPPAPPSAVHWHPTAAFLSLCGTQLLPIGWHPAAIHCLAP